ncbi:RmlC-like cupin domain [Pseudocohnilembus persalinus]|uniref:RmlC-like cupin domain n=1 Tax=Pseudocohnilembus persalinus TaxID=266149 RepID=A0A0V0QK93_PSEPJ|nr:RmlC-like cupin domain [Pseudocohnilembus persalinus]|eukprot:KRX02594.1 RmlC-like cupin domain [Pseudocohnilembus persalinus]
MKVQKVQRKGEIDFNWLKGTHTYSFGSYYNPKYLNYGPVYAVSEYQLEKLEQFEKQELVNCTTYTIVLSGQIRIVNPSKEENKLILKKGDVANFQAIKKLQDSEIEQFKKEMVIAQEDQDQLKQKKEDEKQLKQENKQEEQLKKEEDKKQYEELMNISDKFVIQIQNISDTEIAHFYQIQIFGDNVINNNLQTENLNNKLFTTKIPQQQSEQQQQIISQHVELSDQNMVQVFKNHQLSLLDILKDETKEISEKIIEQEQKLQGLFLQVVEGSVQIELDGQKQILTQGDSLEANLQSKQAKVSGISEKSRVLIIQVDIQNHEQFQQTLL